MSVTSASPTIIVSENKLNDSGDFYAELIAIGRRTANKFNVNVAEERVDSLSALCFGVNVTSIYCENVTRTFVHNGNFNCRDRSVVDNVVDSCCVIGEFKTIQLTGHEVTVRRTFLFRRTISDWVVRDVALTGTGKALGVTLVWTPTQCKEAE